ncbi:hypothetical protein L7F22_049910 [Adiantum nelumboides]|nr:hypothetical protein [Adiantum nelumboides]
MTSPIGTVGTTPSTIVHQTGLTTATTINMEPSTSTPTPRTSAPQGITHFVSRADKLLQMERSATLAIVDAINTIHGAQKMHAVTYESMYEELLDTHQRVYDRDVEKAALFDRNRILNRQATTDCTLWAMDRVTFRNILLQTTSSQRKVYEKFLEDVPLLKSLDKYERAAISDVLKTEYFEAGQNIIVEGQAGDRFYLLEEGEAEAKKGGKVLMRYKRGDYFGELALLNNKPRAATVCAATKCKCASIDRQSFKRLCGKLDNILQQNKKEYNAKHNASKKVSWFG